MGGIVFAPLDEAQLYAAMRKGEGFPMTWGEFRSSFGEEAYRECATWFVENASFESFDDFLVDPDWGHDYGSEPVLG